MRLPLSLPNAFMYSQTTKRQNRIHKSHESFVLFREFRGSFSPLILESGAGMLPQGGGDSRRRVNITRPTKFRHDPPRPSASATR